MDWPLENAGLGESDLTRVFRYVPQGTTVLRLLTTDQTPVLWSHATPEDWEDWLQQCVPSVEKDSGLVLILARRGGASAGLFQRILAGAASPDLSRMERDFKDSFNERDRSYSWPMGEKIPASPVRGGEGLAKGGQRDLKGGTRDLRQLPFEQDTFREICKKFYVHASISRAINRADVPLFSRAEVRIGLADSKQPRHSAIVYNCRSANTWKDDLALTATYFPRNRLTFAILFGCTIATEKQVLNRIAKAKDNAFHPLLLSGIFAELERTRMAEIVEATIDDIEGAIFELDSGAATKETASEFSNDGHPGGTRYIRRTVWLNTTFLRSRLQIWRTQLHKMVEHVEELLLTEFSSSSPHVAPSAEYALEQERKQEHMPQMHRTSALIRDRLQVLIEEYDEKIDECSMRVDGMTIATQWSQGDTNVDIATAAGRDSRQMRSISLVTMVFLPGTFFATLFSMTFFNWFPSDKGDGIVSGYVWIYFVLTGGFTIFTLLSWWYFLVYRQRRTHHFSPKRILACCGMA